MVKTQKKIKEIFDKLFKPECFGTFGRFAKTIPRIAETCGRCSFQKECLRKAAENLEDYCNGEEEQ